MERRNFVKATTACCMGIGLCSILEASGGDQDQKQDIAPSPPSHSTEERMEFAEGWLKNFMQVLDSTLDDRTRRQVMEANGELCARNYLKSIGREMKPVPLETWIDRKKKQASDGSFQIEGKTVYLKFLKNYQGLDAPEGSCLCPFVETKPAGLSATYCHCSVGYIKELLRQTLDHPVHVELVESVLRGGKRCTFRIDLA